MSTFEFAVEGVNVDDEKLILESIGLYNSVSGTAAPSFMTNDRTFASWQWLAQSIINIGFVIGRKSVLEPTSVSSDTARGVGYGQRPVWMSGGPSGKSKLHKQTIILNSFAYGER